MYSEYQKLQLLRKTRYLSLVLLILFLGTLTCSCTKPPQSAQSDFPDKIALSDQYGLAYAPVNVARLKGWFEQELPGTEFKWQTVGNATAIRESMISGRLDGGFMGIPPYLIGLDRGMEWKAVAAVSQANLGLVTLNPQIKSLSNFTSTMRIALPQPGSIQHILLSMAAETQLGDASFFDNRLVSLNHPDSMNALITGKEIAAHFSSPPFLQTELRQPGSHLVLSGNDAFGGPFTFIVLVLSNPLINEFPKAVSGIRRALQRADNWIQDNPDEAARFLQDYYGMDSRELASLFRSGNLIFNSGIVGMEKFQRFMVKTAYLRTARETQELYLP